MGNKKTSSKKIKNKINEFYRPARVSDAVKNIELDFTKYRKVVNRPETELYTKGIYENYNIRQYKNKEEFVNEHKGFVNTDKINELWRDYVYRDKLIQTGQYEEFRLKQYQEGYTTKLKKLNYPSEVVKNIENLSIKDFAKIAMLPNADKTSLKASVLPDIGSFYYPTVGVATPISDLMERNITDIIDVFRQVGLEWEEYDVEKTKYILRRIKYRFVPKSSQKYVIDDGDIDTYIDSLISLIPEEKLEELTQSPEYTNRFDEFYIKGIGSTNKKSKTRAGMLRFIGAVKKSLGDYD